MEVVGGRRNRLKQGGETMTISDGVERLLWEQGIYHPLELLRRLGQLSEQELALWQRGQIPCLEKPLAS